MGSVCSRGAALPPSRRDFLVLAWGLLPPAASLQAAAAEATLATDWQRGLPVADYLVSEKLDGVRALWDGRMLRFRSGRRIEAPSWFTDPLGPVPLDGELWMGRGTFDQLSGTVRATAQKNPAGAMSWNAVRYQVFDSPGMVGSFEERYARLQALWPVGRSGAVGVLEQRRLPDAQALDLLLHRITAEGGEGLVLHRAAAAWQGGRSADLRKLKLQADAEARVVGHQPGQGALAGKLGALLVEDAAGRRFTLGSGFDARTRQNPPAIGTWVTYRYRGHTPAGLPRFASYLRERPPE